MNRTPPRFQHATVANFEPHTTSQRQALSAVTYWFNNLDRGGMLALIGSQGTGKSHLLYSAMKAIDSAIELMPMQLRPALPFVAPWYKLADAIRYGETIITPGGSRQRASHEVRAELWDRKVVMLDEVRATAGTEFDDNELAKFACHAYDNRVAVLITTNVSPLQLIMGDAAASRFTQITIDGPDARQAA